MAVRTARGRKVLYGGKVSILKENKLRSVTVRCFSCDACFVCASELIPSVFFHSLRNLLQQEWISSLERCFRTSFGESSIESPSLRRFQCYNQHRQIRSTSYWTSHCDLRSGSQQAKSESKSLEWLSRRFRLSNLPKRHCSSIVSLKTRRSSFAKSLFRFRQHWSNGCNSCSRHYELSWSFASRSFSPKPRRTWSSSYVSPSSPCRRLLTRWRIRFRRLVRRSC